MPPDPDFPECCQPDAEQGGVHFDPYFQRFHTLTCSKRGPIFRNDNVDPTKKGGRMPDLKQDKRSFDELKELSAGVEAPTEVVSLYHESFRDFGTQALWSRKPSEHPTITLALIIVESLRREGSMKMLPLAARLRRGVVPLSKLQTDILRLLAAHRNPESQRICFS